MKAYVKPELYFESFVLSQTVATCDIQLDQTGSTIINDRIWAGTLNNVFSSGCSIDNASVGFEAYCLTNGTNTFNTFKS